MKFSVIISSCFLHITSNQQVFLPPSIRPRTILGGHTDASIDLSDPISDRFYKEVWMTTAGRNATIYEKVLAVLFFWLRVFPMVFRR